MNKLFADVPYIMLLNELGDYLKMQYDINNANLQKLKHDINLLVEKAVK